MKTIGSLILMLALLAIAGCDDDDTTVVEPGDLAPPLGLHSITGDEAVTLFWWCSNYDDDLVGFKVYSAEGELAGGSLQEVPAGFTLSDSLEVSAPCNSQVQMDVEGLTNGTTYTFLVVAAKGDWGDISHTSNLIEDTPRSESAVHTTLNAHQIDPTTAGYEVSTFERVDCSTLDQDYNTDSGLGDIMCERFDPGAGMRAWIDGINGAAVQDMGYMQDWDDADAAPTGGYASAGHSVEAILGHVYAIWTADDNYAKIQVTEIDEEGPDAWIRVKCAYQPQFGNRELGWE